MLLGSSPEHNAHGFTFRPNEICEALLTSFSPPPHLDIYEVRESNACQSIPKCNVTERLTHIAFQKNMLCMRQHCKMQCVGNCTYQSFLTGHCTVLIKLLTRGTLYLSLFLKIFCFVMPKIYIIDFEMQSAI